LPVPQGRTLLLRLGQPQLFGVVLLFAAAPRFLSRGGVGKQSSSLFPALIRTVGMLLHSWAGPRKLCRLSSLQARIAFHIESLPLPN